MGKQATVPTKVAMAAIILEELATQVTVMPKEKVVNTKTGWKSRKKRKRETNGYKPEKRTVG
jgi:hypothetical protein